MTKRKQDIPAALQSWEALNTALSGASAQVCRELLDQELRGKKRLQFMLRIHSRLNKARADNERLELRKAAQ